MFALMPTINKNYRRELDEPGIGQGRDRRRREENKQKATLNHTTCSKSHILEN